MNRNRMLVAVCSKGLCLSGLLIGAVATAGKYNQQLNIGDQAPTFSELPGIDGKNHAFADWQSKKALVIVFTCNSCPYAVDAEDRLIALQKKYADKAVEVIAINVNKVKEDSLEAMKEKAKSKKFPFSYLYDESQQIARAFGAIYTPEFYVLDQNRKVAYMGAMDDSPDGKRITKRYVEDALDAVLAGGKPTVTETPAIGCRVRYERARRSRRARE